MQDKKIEKIAAVAVNITKMLVIIYLGFIEVFKTVSYTHLTLPTISDV